MSNSQIRHGIILDRLALTGNTPAGVGRRWPVLVALREKGSLGRHPKWPQIPAWADGDVDAKILM